MIWKSKLKSEKIWKKGKLNSEKIWSKSKLNDENDLENIEQK
jgi:hypothetical protein